MFHMLQTSLEERIGLILDTRFKAATSLAKVLASHRAGLSERAICDQWIADLDSREINACGWYQPPPKGTCVLIGSQDDGFRRLGYDSMRHTSTWSREDIIQQEDSLIYAYASPIVRGAGLMGDIGLTLYSGQNSIIHNHLARCLEATARIATLAEVDMPLRDLFKIASELLKSYDFSNSASKLISGLENIGHTIPWSYEDYTEKAEQCLSCGTEGAIRDLMNNQRVSINASATLSIQPTMAFTVEPQIVSDDLPLCSYHLIVTFTKGVRKISPSFSPFCSSKEPEPS